MISEYLAVTVTVTGTKTKNQKILKQVDKFILIKGNKITKKNFFNSFQSCHSYHFQAITNQQYRTRAHRLTKPQLTCSISTTTTTIPAPLILILLPLPTVAL